MSFFNKIADAFTDSKAQENQETRALLAQATRAYEHAGLQSVDVQAEALDVLGYWEEDEGKLVPEPLCDKLVLVGAELLRGCGLYSPPPEPNFDDPQSTLNCRDWCRNIAPIYNDFSTYQNHVGNVLLNVYHALLKTLPESLFSTETGEKSVLTFPVPALHILPHPERIADDVISRFYGDEVFDSPIFSRIRTRIYRNFAEMENVYNVPKGRNIRALSDFDGKHPARELIEWAFSGLPLKSIFDFEVPVALTTSDRFKHQYVLGKTGSGKSVALRYQIAHDIHAGYGVVVITPEKQLIEDALSYVPDHRRSDVVYFDASDDQAPVVGFNPFTLSHGDLLSQKAGELEAILIRTLGDMGVKMRPVLSNTIYALLQCNGALTDIPRLLDPWDTSYREKHIDRLDPRTQEFFLKYEQSKYYKDAYEPIINRLDTLLRPPLCETLTTPSLDFPRLLNKKHSIVLCDMSRLRGFQAEVTGQLLLSVFQQTFFQRDLIPEKDRIPYFFYMDEFQTYATSNESSLKDFLTRARKYKVGIVMAHQNTKDIPEGLLSSIFGNCGTLFGMLMSAEDAKKFSRESQLTNFGHGSESQAPLQLQNLKAGEVAVCTPETKKAQLCRIPEFPPFDRDYDIVPSLKAETKAVYGLQTTPPGARGAAPAEPTEAPESDTAPPEDTPTKKDDDDNDGWGDLGYRLT